jgi:TRAP-type mannitol/chloroaromatic compound transport system substrate-binding protein
LNQVVVNADLYINGDVYNKLSDQQKTVLEAAANASLSKAMSYRIYKNGKALKDLMHSHGAQLHGTPPDYFKAYKDAPRALLEKNARDNVFCAKVWQSQEDNLAQLTKSC